MSLEETESTISSLSGRSVNGGDFASFFADDVMWTTMETGDQIHGREAVRDFIIALHSQFFGATPEVVNTAFTDGVAGLEAVLVGTHTLQSSRASQRPVPPCGIPTDRVWPDTGPTGKSSGGRVLAASEGNARFLGGATRTVQRPGLLLAVPAEVDAELAGEAACGVEQVLHSI